MKLAIIISFSSLLILRCPEDPVPYDIFIANDTESSCKHLSRYVVETRKENGESYPPSTIHSLLCGILHHMRTINPSCVNFLDKKDFRFTSLHKTLDSLFNRSYSEGIGTPKS